jgi:hypothetical protein
MSLTFEERNQVSLGSLLKGHDGGGLETQVGLEVLGDFYPRKARLIVMKGTLWDEPGPTNLEQDVGREAS